MEQDPFTIENQLLTPSMKKNRPTLRRKYAEIVNRLSKERELKGKIFFILLYQMSKCLLEFMESEFDTEVSETDNVFSLAGDSLSKVRLIFKVLAVCHSRIHSLDGFVIDQREIWKRNTFRIRV